MARKTNLHLHPAVIDWSVISWKQTTSLSIHSSFYVLLFRNNWSNRQKDTRPRQWSTSNKQLHRKWSLGCLQSRSSWPCTLPWLFLESVILHPHSFSREIERKDGSKFHEENDEEFHYYLTLTLTLFSFITFSNGYRYCCWGWWFTFLLMGILTKVLLKV